MEESLHQSRQSDGTRAISPPPPPPSIYTGLEFLEDRAFLSIPAPIGPSTVQSKVCRDNPIKMPGMNK